MRFNEVDLHNGGLSLGINLVDPDVANHVAYCQLQPVWTVSQAAGSLGLLVGIGMPADHAAPAKLLLMLQIDHSLKLIFDWPIGLLHGLPKADGVILAACHHVQLAIISISENDVVY